MSGDFPDPHFKCPNCGQMIDPETCWCGQPIDHGYDSTHGMAIPMGCDCYILLSTSERNALCQTVRAAWTMLDLGRRNAPHTEDTGEVCTEGCEGCRNPVAALIHDRNSARRLAYQRGLEIDKLQSQIESTVSLNAALREQLAESERVVKMASSYERGARQKIEDLESQLAQVEKELSVTKQHRDDLIEELRREQQIGNKAPMTRLGIK